MHNFLRPFHECAHIFHARHPDCAAAAAAAAAAVEVVAGEGQFDEGSIAARAAPRGRGLAFGGGCTVTPARAHSAPACGGGRGARRAARTCASLMPYRLSTLPGRGKEVGVNGREGLRAEGRG